MADSHLRLEMQIDKNELQIEGAIRRHRWPICHPVKVFSPFFCTGTEYKRWSYVLFFLYSQLYIFPALNWSRNHYFMSIEIFIG